MGMRRMVVATSACRATLLVVWLLLLLLLESCSISVRSIATARHVVGLQATRKEELEEQQTSFDERRKMHLMWCSTEYCKDSVRERVVGEHNQILLSGPATGQVAYQWISNAAAVKGHRDDGANNNQQQRRCSVFLLVKQKDDRLLQIAAEAVQNLTASLLGENVQILLDPPTAARLKFYHGVDNIQLLEITPTPGYGNNLRLPNTDTPAPPTAHVPDNNAQQPIIPDLICTLGGDGLLMHASMMFQGPVPPILCVAGGSLGFLTPFTPDEMVQAIIIALGMVSEKSSSNRNRPLQPLLENDDIEVFPPNMPSYPYEPLPKTAAIHYKSPRFAFGWGDRICLSIRMRLECRVISREGRIRARYNVLNEVVIDRGSSPYLAALECFCDDVHLTTVQADGVIFATPTGSTAYSLAAGSSVVHPAVPCILVTPICPHVLSFRSMVFPDHVVLRCYVPDDARAEASVAFDGKHRQELHRGDSVQVQMSAYPVPTINRQDHSSDWLGSLKRNFNFNSRPRQQPL